MKIGILLIKVFILGCNWLTHNPGKFRVSPQYVAVVQLVRMMDSKSIGRGFESFPLCDAFFGIIHKSFKIVLARESRHYILKTTP